MAMATGFVSPRVTPFTFPLSNNNKFSLRPFHKHLQCTNSSLNKKLHILKPLTPFHTKLNYPLLVTKKSNYLHTIRCSYADTATSDDQNPLSKTLKNLSFDSVKETIFSLTPLGIIKWGLVLSLFIAVTKRVVDFLLNPFVWMYFSWTWLFWPWFVAISIAIYGIYSFSKHIKGESNVIEQLAIVTSAFTWLTLVPPAHFNGYLEGWPFVFFFVYHYFFFFSVTIRKRMYGDYLPCEHDPKWDISPPNLYRFLFCIGVMVAHWLAAFEGPELHLVPGGWNNLWVWGLIMVTLFMQYNATLYLAKYSENVVVPTAVVQFGPYRWVRHPIYASTMLLFATYFAALRAPISLLFVVGVCLAFYEQKAKMEEGLMVETFGENYSEYAKKVRYKFIPFVY